MLRAMDDADVKRKLEAKTYTRGGEAGQVIGLDLGLKGRTVPRYKRCQNCQWFDTSENFDAQLNQRLLTDARHLRDMGATQPVIDAQSKKLRDVIDGNRGDVGYCMRRLIRRDKQAADHFTSAGYLCDQWSGAFGLKVGPEGAPAEKLPDELLEAMGEKNPPRPGEEDAE